MLPFARAIAQECVTSVPTGTQGRAGVPMTRDHDRPSKDIKFFEVGHACPHWRPAVGLPSCHGLPRPSGAAIRPGLSAVAGQHAAYGALRLRHTAPHHQRTRSKLFSIWPL